MTRARPQALIVRSVTWRIGIPWLFVFIAVQSEQGNPLYALRIITGDMQHSVLHLLAEPGRHLVPTRIAKAANEALRLTQTKSFDPPV